MTQMLRLSRMTIRTRLTLVYGGLFLLAALVLLGVTYALVSSRLPDASNTTSISAGNGPSFTHGESQGQPPTGAGPPGSMALDGQIRGAQQDVLGSLLTQGGLALAVVGAAAVVLGWLLAGRLLQPLHRVTDTARRIAEAPAADRGLHERIALRGPRDEIKKLADTFDVMLERLDHSFDGQRRFIASASHELRTPLTLNRALLEVAVHRRAASPEVVQLGETLLEINARHERLIDGLLMLARSEPEVTDRSFVDLADVADHVVCQTPSGNITVHTDLSEAPTVGNPVLLERLVQNLVENGVRHNVPDDGRVLVGTTTLPDGAAVLTVANTGPVVPRYEVPGLFEPFRRLGAERVSAGAEGAGLGLSIVRSVTRAHGGEVRLEPRDGGGLTATVILPGAGCPRHDGGRRDQRRPA